MPTNPSTRSRLQAAALRIGIAGLLAVSLSSCWISAGGPAQLIASGQALMQSERLAKSVSQALVGNPKAFLEVHESAEALAKNVRALKYGDASLSAAPSDVQRYIDPLLPLVERAEKNANTLVFQQKVLVQTRQALRAINTQSADLLESAEKLMVLELVNGARPAELAAAGQLVMLTQRTAKSANEFLTLDSVNPDAVFLLGKDLKSFPVIAKGLADGNPELRLPGTKDAQTKAHLATLLKQHEETRRQGELVLSNLQGLVAAREAQAMIVADNEALRTGLERVLQSLGP